jgi:serine/threonine-protein kinase HipA
MEICRDYKYVKAEEYIEQTLAKLADWWEVFTRLNVPHKAGEPIFNDWRSCIRISRSKPKR